MAPSKMTSTLKSNAEANELTVRWGAFDVPGLDPKRAQAIGLEPAVKKIGYGSSSQELPPMLTHEGTIARYCRRTAELMLQTSEHWEQIELKTRDTNNYYKELLTNSRVQEEAYRTAADILSKIMARPGSAERVGAVVSRPAALQAARARAAGAGHARLPGDAQGAHAHRAACTTPSSRSSRSRTIA